MARCNDFTNPFFPSLATTREVERISHSGSDNYEPSGGQPGFREIRAVGRSWVLGVARVLGRSGPAGGPWMMSLCCWARLPSLVCSSKTETALQWAPGAAS